MSEQKSVFTDPVAAALILCCFAFAFIALFAFALFVVLPVAALTVAGVLLYRWHILQKIKAPDHAPETIKDRPDYVEPSLFLKTIEHDRWLLNDAEEETGKYSCAPLAEAFHYVTASLYGQESFHEPPRKPDTRDRITLGRYFDQLGAWQRKVSDNNNFELFTGFMLQWWLVFREYLPPFALQSSLEPSPTPLTTPLKLHDEQEAVPKLIGSFFDDDFKRRGLFTEVREQIERNVEDDPDLTFANCFAKTPFRNLLRVQIPVPLPDETRFAGTWVVAPQGMGKTTLLHNLIIEDLKKDASIILMDSKGDLIEPFLTHPALANRRIIVGPDNPIGMNPLDIPRTDINKAVDNLEYLFSSLLDFKLTAGQSMLLKVVFRSIVTTFPNPTLSTFQEVMADDGPRRYADYIKNLEPDLQRFFAHEFKSDNIRSRRQEVLQRLRLLLDHDLLRSMLMASSTTFRIGEAMDRGAVIIINNSRGKLGIKGAEFFGRFFIAQVLAAAQERSFRKSSEKRPVYFYIDECHTVIEKDERITDVLHECRSQKIALTLAHQETSQVSDYVLSALQNCAIRFARPDDETLKLAPSVRMEAKALRSLRTGQFAAYIRGLSQQGIVVNVALPELDTLPTSQISYTPRPTTLSPPNGGHEDAAQTPSPEDRGSREPTTPKADDVSSPSPTDSPAPPAPSPKSNDPDAAQEWTA